MGIETNIIIMAAFVIGFKACIFHPLVYIYEHTDEPETNETSVITIVIVFYCATE